MKILVLSDSHGSERNMELAVEIERPNYLIHLGDCVRDAEKLSQIYPQLPVAMVKGNCDYGTFDISELRIAEYASKRIMMCHGHRYGVKTDLSRLRYAAMEQNADVILFGHTHQPFCERYDNMWMLNPGSCQNGIRPTCGIIEIINGTVFCRLRQIEERMLEDDSRY